MYCDMHVIVCDRWEVCDMGTCVIWDVCVCDMGSVCVMGHEPFVLNNRFEN